MTTITNRYPPAIEQALARFKRQQQNSTSIATNFANFINFFAEPLSTDLATRNDDAVLSKLDADLLMVRRPVVHPNDTFIVNVIAPFMVNGPWIAGGAPRLWIKGHPVGAHDIDVWCSSPEQAALTIDRIRHFGGSSTILYESDNALTFSVNDQSGTKTWKLQLILKDFPQNDKDIIKKFDFTVVQLVTDGISVNYGIETMADLNANALEMAGDEQIDLIKRLFKYIAYGYVPSIKMMDWIYAHADQLKWDFSSDGAEGDYNNV